MDHALSRAVTRALGSVHDPCCAERGLSLVDMGLVRSVEVGGDPERAEVRVELLLTSGWCPFAAHILEQARRVIEALDGVGRATVEITFEEAWTMDRLSERARRALVFLPEPRTVARRDGLIASIRSASGEAAHDR